MGSAAAGILGGLSVFSAFEQRKARKSRERARAAERRRARASNLRARNRALADQQIQTSQAEVLAENLGVAEASTVQGAIGGARSETFSNIGFQQQIEAIQQEKLEFLNEASRATTRAGIANTLSSAVSQNAGQINEFFNSGDS